MSGPPLYRSAHAQQLAMRAYQDVLDSWPVPAVERSVPTREGETFVLEFGERTNPPLVLLHGSAANSSTWAGDAATWAKDFHAFAVDLPGETGKSTHRRPPYAGTTYADWLADVLDGLGLGRASIAGLSLGGWAALKLASHYPARAGRVALISPGGVVQAKLGFVLRAAVYQRLGRRGIRRITREVFGPRETPPGAEEGFAFMLRNYRARRDNLPPLDDEELRRITAPVWFIGGDSDALIDMAATRERLERLLAGFEGEIVPGAGHVLFGVAAKAVAWLGRPSSETPAPGPGDRL